MSLNGQFSQCNGRYLWTKVSKSRRWRCSFAACAGESVWQILCALVLVVDHLAIKHGLELPHLYQMFHWFLEGSCFFLPPKKGFTHRRSAFGTDSGDSYGQPRSWKIHLGRRLTCWKVGDRCGDLFDRKKIEVTFSLFYMISDICWYLWKPCGVWSICENTRLFPALFRVSRSVYRNPPSKSINKWVWTVWTRKFYLEPSAKMGFIQIYKSKNRSNVRLNKTESFSFFLKHVSQSLISGAAQGYYLFPCSG